jgi:predicted glycosyltransferase involved in capsule biosynthesis
MKKILLCCVFWTDGYLNSTRERNIHYTWERIKHLNNFLKENQINSEIKLYDFSPQKIVDDSIHIPYELGDFKKSEKLNIVLKNNLEFEFIMMFDADCFFLEKDYQEVLKLLQSINKKDLICFDCAKIYEKDVESIIETNEIDLEKIDWWFAYSGEKKNGPLAFDMKGNLGGVYIVDINLLTDVGMFDERIKGWGNEDSELMSRIYSMKKHNEFNHIAVRNIFPFHLPHYVDLENPKYKNRY